MSLVLMFIMTGYIGYVGREVSIQSKVATSHPANQCTMELSSNSRVVIAYSCFTVVFHQAGSISKINWKLSIVRAERKH